MKTLLVAVGSPLALWLRFQRRQVRARVEDVQTPAPTKRALALPITRSRSARLSYVHHDRKLVPTTTPTGSFIPLVVRRYKGVNQTMGASQRNDVHTGSNVGATGVLDLGSNLKRLDPDIF